MIFHGCLEIFLRTVNTTREDMVNTVSIENDKFVSSFAGVGVDRLKISCVRIWFGKGITISLETRVKQWIPGVCQYLLFKDIAT